MIASMSSPETRPSLLLRLRDSSDHDSWQEFCDIYRPIIVRLALKKGLQNADAEDLAQQVLVAISGAIERWQPDSGRAQFRTWLHRVTHNAILNAVRQSAHVARATEDWNRALLEQPARTGPDSALLQIETRRQILAWAAKRIRCEFSESTWMSFWLTAVEERSVDEVAIELDRTAGSIYASRSRVMKRLKRQVDEFTEPDGVLSDG